MPAADRFQATPSDRPKAFLWLFGLMSLVILVGAESAYRIHRYRTNVVDTRFLLATVDVPPTRTSVGQSGSIEGPFRPKHPFTLRLYGADGNLARTIHVHVNNLGWISRFDYSAAKAVKEYRIAIIGNSLTASINNEIPWPDVVQRTLAADQELLRTLDATSITVLNLGVPGGGYEFARRNTAPTAKRLSADLLIYNVTTKTDLLTFQASPSRRRYLSQRLQFLSRGNIQIPVLCSPDIPILRDCRPSVQWHVPPDEEPLPPSRITELKRWAATETLVQRLTTNPLPLLFVDRMGPSRAPARAASATERDKTTIENISLIRKMHPHLVLTLNPLPWEFAPADQRDSVDRFLIAMGSAGIEIVNMYPRLPDATELERATWFNMPVDGHWSDKGAEVYGKKVAQLIRDKLIQERVLQVNANPRRASQ